LVETGATVEFKMPNNSFWTRLDPGSRYAVQRFALKLGMLLAFAALEAGGPYGAGRALHLMLNFVGLVDMVIALFQRAWPFGSTLTYWDEAAIFFMLSLALHWVL
jgi:hypothetical protein